MLPQSRNRQNSVVCFAALLFAALFTVHLIGCSREQQSPPKPRARRTGDAASARKSKIDPRNTVAVLQTAKGAIEIEFFVDLAPKTVDNFLKNVRLEYYNNGEFHRVEPGKIIQAKGRFAALDETIAIEKSSQKPVRGVVVMAKAEGASVSDAAQFFICLDTVELDSDYTMFGKVISGLDVMDKITPGDKILKATTRDKG